MHAERNPSVIKSQCQRNWRIFSSGRTYERLQNSNSSTVIFENKIRKNLSYGFQEEIINGLAKRMSEISSCIQVIRTRYKSGAPAMLLSPKKKELVK